MIYDGHPDGAIAFELSVTTKPELIVQLVGCQDVLLQCVVQVAARLHNFLELLDTLIESKRQKLRKPPVPAAIFRRRHADCRVHQLCVE